MLIVISVVVLIIIKRRRDESEDFEYDVTLDKNGKPKGGNGYSIN